MTIDELMEGQEPGSITAIDEHGMILTPHFKDAEGYWFGLDVEGNGYSSAADTGLWQIYVSPKPKVKKWQWLISDGEGGHFSTMGYYTKRGLIHAWALNDIVQRLDHTEIEVEE